MDKTVGSGLYKGQIATFVTVDGSDAKLGDLTPVAINPEEAVDHTNFQIQFVGSDGAQMTVANCPMIAAMDNGEAIIAKYGAKVVMLRYVPAKDGTPAQWYLEADKDAKRARLYEMSAMKIPCGQGYTVQAGDALSGGAKLTYSGQVLDKDFPVSVGSGVYMSSGNIAPRDMKLGDFVPVAIKESPHLL